MNLQDLHIEVAGPASQGMVEVQHNRLVPDLCHPGLKSPAAGIAALELCIDSKRVLWNLLLLYFNKGLVVDRAIAFRRFDRDLLTITHLHPL